ncbi:MAG: hypothetical protein CMP72_02170 [Flavobacteriales bacterium]|nr:hypothetical protein [Flavobacteriales bacterium]|tara:strand:- start:505 stop:1182 length:678 start_codon:yes stop_codon:yes gene_type:complete
MHDQNSIIKLLKEKSATKQIIYRNTKNVFDNLVNSLKEKEKSLSDILKSDTDKVELEFKSNGQFDAQLKFAGDTLLFHMHSNVFDFPPNHQVSNSKYVKEDNLRGFCGIINIYNFLSDSLKYNRLNDEGILIGRIFINKDNHFFVEGDKELGFLFDDFANQQMNSDMLDQIINVCMVYTLNFDLFTPNFNDVRLISVHQIATMSMNQKIKTSKRLGYKFSHENKS